MVVDDAQWLDEASAVVLHQLVAQRDVTLLATSRTDEPAPEPVTALWKDGLVDRIDVAPLDDESVRDLLESALDGPVETLTATRLWQRCSGNALYLRELVGEAARLDLFQRRDGLWCIDRLPPGSPRLAELVAQRLGALDEDERAALEIIAVGEPIRLEMLDELVERDTVERLEAAGVAAIGRHGDQRRRPARPPALRRRRAIVAPRPSASPAHPQPGRHPRASGCHRSGGLDAPGALAPRRRRHARPPGSCWRRPATPTSPSTGQRPNVSPAPRGPPTARSRRRTSSPTCCSHAGGTSSSKNCSTTRRPSSRTDEQRAGRRRVPRPRVLLGLADGEAAERILVEAEAEVTDPEWWSELRATRATLVGQSGRHREVLALLADVPATTMSGRARLQAGLAEAFALPGVGRGEEALARIDEAMSAGAQVGPQLTLFRAGLLLSAKAMALVSLGRLDDAAEAARSGREAAIATGNRAAEGFFGATLGWVQLHQGLLVSAQRTYRESATAFRASSHRGPLRWALGGLLFAAALARDREVATEAGRALDSLGAHPAALFDTAISRARAWEAVAAGDPERARLLLRDAADEARSRGAVLDEAAALHDLARLGRAHEVAERLGRLADGRAGGVPRGSSPTAPPAYARGDPSALGDVAERFAASGFNLRAAESAMAASEASARAHDQRSAARWARRATELAARCEAPATVELVGRGRAGAAHDPRARDRASWLPTGCRPG